MQGTAVQYVVTRYWWLPLLYDVIYRNDNLIKIIVLMIHVVINVITTIVIDYVAYLPKSIFYMYTYCLVSDSNSSSSDVNFQRMTYTRCQVI